CIHFFPPCCCFGQSKYSAAIMYHISPDLLTIYQKMPSENGQKKQDHEAFHVYHIYVYQIYLRSSVRK
ncbi:MAG: hypothetical protein ACI4ET_10235, partial [Bilifractor sp.]